MNKLIAVVGSRTKSKESADLVGKLVHQEVHKDLTDKSIIWVSGGALSGADYWIKHLCRTKKARYLEAVAFWDYPTNFGKHDKSAGLFRNETIVRVADELLVFYDGSSTGTAHTIKLANEYGKPMKIIQFGLNIPELDHPDKPPVRPPCQTLTI